MAAVLASVQVTNARVSIPGARLQSRNNMILIVPALKGALPGLKYVAGSPARPALCSIPPVTTAATVKS